MAILICYPIIPLSVQSLVFTGSSCPVNIHSFISRVCNVDVHSVDRLGAGLSYREEGGDFTLKPYHQDCILSGKVFLTTEDLQRYLQSKGVIADSRFSVLDPFGGKILLPEYLQYTQVTKTLVKRLGYMLRTVGSMEKFIASKGGVLLNPATKSKIPIGENTPLYRRVDIYPNSEGVYDMMGSTYEIL